jgi:putative flippase GtrA
VLTIRNLQRRLKPVAAAGIGGVLGTAVDVVVLSILYHRGVSIAVATFIGAAAGAVLCFVGNKYVAFRDPRPLAARQVVSFAGVSIAAAVLMAITMHVACGAGLPYLTAKLICALLVFACWSYPAQRHLVFA